MSILRFAGILTAVITLCLVAPPLRSGGQNNTPISLGGRRELFVDYFIIERMSGAALQLHQPHREGIALSFDLPWEGVFSGYVTVIHHEGTYRMYYRGLPQTAAGRDSGAVTCYAESKDGITWVKPNLGMYEVSGTRENNVILANMPVISHNFSPFLDTRPGIPYRERFKGVGGDAKSGLIAFVSADGVHWRRLRTEPILTKGMFDSQNVVFWSEYEQRYICYFRTWTGQGYTGYRTISRSTSTDFLVWSDPVEMTYGDTPREHLYTNGTGPYFRSPQIYLGLAKRFFPDRSALPAEAAKRLVENPGYRASSSDAVLLSTRGGNRYDRTFMEAFIPPGPDPRDWVARDNTPALGIVSGNVREVFLYRMSHYAQPTSHVMRYSLRLDGFVSVRAPYEGGEMITKPFTFEGKQLEINFSSSAAGGVRVEIQDSSGHPLPGFGLDDCLEMIGDDIERCAVWKTGPDVSVAAGTVVRLRFVMADADLYSFRFR